MALLGTAAAAAYLEAKFHLSSDVNILWKLYRGEREYLKAGMFAPPQHARNSANETAANGKGNLWFCFYENALQNPEKRCIWTREAQYTYRQTLAKTIQYAHYFYSLGVRRGQLVAFYLQNRPEFIFAWLALWALGCAPATVNYNLAGEGLEHCLRLSGAQVLLVDDDPECVKRVEDSRPVLEGELGFQIVRVDQVPLHSFPDSVLPDDGKDAYDMDGEFSCMLLYTSGTTGMPKGTSFTMRRLYPRAYERRVSSAPDECWYSCMPLYHGTGGITQIVNISVGTTIALGKRFSARSFWPDVRDSESTAFVYVGEAARYLLAAPPSPLDRQHKVRCMHGNGLRPDVWERFRERFGVPRVLEFFSSSEGMLGLLNDNRGPFTSGSVGHHGLLLRFLLRNTFVPVAVDPSTGDIVREANGYAVRQPYTTGGEILVCIPDESAFQGYWRNKEATQKKFVRNVFQQGDLYYRSGDALRRTDDGRWYFLDRLGDTFRWKSENVYVFPCLPLSSPVIDQC